MMIYYCLPWSRGWTGLGRSDPRMGLSGDCHPLTVDLCCSEDWPGLQVRDGLVTRLATDAGYWQAGQWGLLTRTLFASQRVTAISKVSPGTRTGKTADNWPEQPTVSSIVFSTAWWPITGSPLHSRKEPMTFRDLSLGRVWRPPGTPLLTSPEALRVLGFELDKLGSPAE